MASKYEMDMCNGPIIGKILLFSIPLMFSGLLQLLFNAVDVIVVGKFAGDTALAAVGSTSSLICLIVNFFVGLSIGTNIVVARFIGEKNFKDIHDTVHTAIGMSLVSGVIIVIIGALFATNILQIMQCPEDVIELSTKYLRIYFLGMPGFMAYNFGAAILRAMGDTRRPMLYLTVAGVVNVVLNLYFVIVLKIDVAGVAIATIISQYISGLLVLKCLTKTEGYFHLDMRNLMLKKDKVITIVKVGAPAGLQSILFSISNITIQSSVNSFGSLVMAGSTASSSVEGFVYTALSSIQQTAMSFISQNYGAKNFKRIIKIALICVCMSTVLGLVAGFTLYALGEFIFSIYTNDPAVVQISISRYYYVGRLCFLCGLMDLMVGILRGVGYSVIPMITSLIGVCGFRIFWVSTVFKMYPTTDVLFLSYPVSWIVTLSIQIAFIIAVFNKVKMKTTCEIVQ